MEQNQLLQSYHDERKEKRAKGLGVALTIVNAVIFILYAISACVMEYGVASLTIIAFLATGCLPIVGIAAVGKSRVLSALTNVAMIGPAIWYILFGIAMWAEPATYDDGVIMMLFIFSFLLIVGGIGILVLSIISCCFSAAVKPEEHHSSAKPAIFWACVLAAVAIGCAIGVFTTWAIEDAQVKAWSSVAAGASSVQQAMEAAQNRYGS